MEKVLYAYIGTGRDHLYLQQLPGALTPTPCTQAAPELNVKARLVTSDGFTSSLEYGLHIIPRLRLVVWLSPEVVLRWCSCGRTEGVSYFSNIVCILPTLDCESL